MTDDQTMDAEFRTILLDAIKADNQDVIDRIIGLNGRTSVLSQPLPVLTPEQGARLLVRAREPLEATLEIPEFDSDDEFIHDGMRFTRRHDLPLSPATGARILAKALRSLREPVENAHAHLSTLETDVPDLAGIVVRNLPDGIYANADDGMITISPLSPFYKQAEAGDPLALAMLLAHEFHHIQFGPAEIPAYEASLAFCAKHRAPASLVSEVEARLEIEKEKEK